MIESDERRFMQVLLNLVSNSLKFTQKGHVRIIISIDHQENADYLSVDVEDTGVGVPYKDQDKLFKLFGFVKDTQALNTNGIGLGLVIS
mmetsp:Transcript_12278/g.19043  ORF Transcript_12278/g.19043 Transcript_12278/m.19043 type:complete len:89 (+) Transcript_12278:1620-1886(+)